MPRLLVGADWYEAVASTNFYEVHFEALVLRHAPYLYPAYFAVPFKTTLTSEHGTAKPDLALIDKEYRTWWVVEVELAHHSLHNHVLPQIQVFSSASYGPNEAGFLAAQNPDLSRNRLLEMVRGAPPGILVLVNQAVPTWQVPLAIHRASVGIVEVFRSDRNDTILRINGDQPAALGSLVSICRFDSLLPRLLVVDSPAGLGPGVEGLYIIEFQGSISEWTKIEIADRVWLSPRGANPLPAATSYQLRREESGRLVFQATIRR